MKKLYLIIYFLFLGFSLSPINAQNTENQIIMSQRMQYSQLASPEDKQLFLIDFWATWCAPCIHVAKYLNIVQEKYANELYVLSLTEENPDVVEKFLKRHTTKLAVSIDYESTNFKTHNIKSLPYAILFNADGKIIWKGNPADLKDHHIDRFLRQNRKKTPIYNVLQYKSYTTEEQNVMNIEGDFLLKEIDFKNEELPAIEQLSNDLISVQGSLTQIIAYLFNINTQQIEILKHKNKSYQLILKSDIDKNSIIPQILQQLSISVHKSTKMGEVLEATLTSYNNLWDKNQIQWGAPNAKFLIDDKQITIDNMSIYEVLALIAQLQNIPVELMNQSQYINSKPYDWQIHYKFRDLLLNNLNDYGFKTNIVQKNYTTYLIK